MLSQALIEDIIFASFSAEIKAFKPGNVSTYADGHDMTSDDFLHSAKVSTPILAQPNYSLGQRLLTAVQATQDAVHCNTNLGMLLLYAPIIMAYQQAATQPINWAILSEHIQKIVTSATVTDVATIYQAITMANPAGLGHLATHDVRQKPQCSLFEAMQVAGERGDFIALQYVNQFAQVAQGYEHIKYYHDRWHSLAWSIVACYLFFLANYTDSHILRKHGKEIAKQTQQSIKPFAKLFMETDNPDDYMETIQDIDITLKKTHINPGTSADMSAASILIYKICHTI